MLPQMMPLPWVFIFVLSFISIFSIMLFVSSTPKDQPLSSPLVKPSGLILSW